jgi:aldehyde dehydrogenase (NAD+)
MLHKNLIGSAWVEGVSVFENINPSDLSDVVGQYSFGDASQVNAAAHSAKEASKIWALSGVQARADALDKIGSEILQRREELGDLLAREEGKTLPEAIGEVTRAGHIFKFFSGECLRLRGEVVASVRPNIGVEITREPVGVVGIITPWNFPIAIPAWKIAPALAYGNAVVFKPADLVPGCASALAEIISRSGIPAGVFNLVMGEGKTVGEAIVNHPLIDAVSFTGSQQVGRLVAQACVVRNKKIQLEMGGKNPQVILDDADLQTAVNLCVQSAYYSTGQRCTASSRLIVTQQIYPAFIKALEEKTRGLVVGDARTKSTDIGPVVSRQQLVQDASYIKIAEDEGARLLCGGKVLTLDKEGYYFSPALFVDTHSSMRINQEEVFGPIASVIQVKDYEEALATANDTKFGLSAGIATTSLKFASHFKQNSKAGMVMVNLPTAGVDYHVPFGGRKSSSYGAREQGSYAAEFYTIVKTSYTYSG